MQSTRFTLNAEDIKKWSKNTFIFFAPALLIFLMAIQSGKSPKEAFIAIEVWALNTAVDLLRKFLAGSLK